eukprot:XP_011665650.1 PREDICTED: NFX1-type zinc finger-containing protein 1 [Strongylocentrotus purpuratus]
MNVLKRKGSRTTSSNVFIFKQYMEVGGSVLGSQVSTVIMNVLKRKGSRTTSSNVFIFKQYMEVGGSMLGSHVRCIQDIAIVLSELQQRLPRYLTDVEVAVTLLEDAVIYAEKRNILVDETIQEEVRQLVKFHETIQQEKLKKTRTDIEPTTPPPDNFRELNENDEGEEELDILEEADLLDEMRRLDVDDQRNRIFTGDANANFDDDTLAFRLNDLDNLEAGGWQQDRRQLRNRKHNLERKLRSNERMSDQEANTVRNVWGLEEGNRWRLYRYWAHLHRHESLRQLVDMQRQFTNVCQELREARSQEDFEILKNASVVGMTTTGAAKFHMLLQRIQPRIMVVEEAAEVLEAHIVTALTESCQHLILIGDHQQLRPSPTVFKLATQYNLDISLFERMINNEVPYQQLVLQHRMRPEISRLMRMERLYPYLQDDVSVKKFDDIHGVTKNIFFLHHEMEEDSVDEMKSHSNIHEAKFLVGLCRYFLQQGYLPEQITILTTYSGQLFRSREARKGLLLASENFKLLHNKTHWAKLCERKSSWIAADNVKCRSCVERAKSCTMICEEMIRRSDWPCGHNVLVKCSAGPESCSKPCDTTLSCEHPCKGSCGECRQGRLHAFCREKCDRTLVCGHPCRSTCAADCPPCSRKCENRCQHSKCKKNCGEPCVPCAERCIWRCQHFRCRAQCGKPCDRRACDDPCTLLLKCGHPCIGLCGEPCPKKCRICDKEEVTRILFGDEEDDDARFVELEDCKHVIEVDALDQWMKTDSGSKDTSEATSIKLKECPWCKTPIRRNLRYGNLIKQALNDINAVKRTIFGNESTIHYLRQNLQEKFRREVENMDMLAIGMVKKLFLRKMDARRFHDMVSSTSALSHGQITALENRVRFLEEMRDLVEALQSLRSPSLNQQYVKQMKSEIVVLQTWLCQEPINRMSHQQTDDANREAKRLHLALILFRTLVEKPAARDKASQEVKAAELQLFDGKALNDQRADEVKSLLKKIVSKSGGLGISDEERKDIVAAMGLAKGHWFKCPKGHVYAIGNCGGAQQASSCPECGLGIGGTQYRLREGNRLASEMDGAQQAAFPPR